MGFYVEAPNKGAWLKKNGIEIAPPLKHVDVTDESVVVCLVDNGPFDAAGIMYSQDELNCFKSPDDTRPKRWFSVPIAAVEENCPQVRGWIK